MARYLLPCNCGKQVPVGAAQAGETVVCSCGQKLTAPTLRALRELKTESEPEAPSRATAWNPLQGYLFSFGTIAALAGLAIGCWQLFIYSQIKPYTVDQSVQVTANMSADIDQMNLLESLEEWEHNLSKGLDLAQTPGWVEAQTVANSYLRKAMIALIVAACGFAAATAAFFLKSPQSAG